MSTIDARVARLEDRAELEDLVVRYFLAADGDDTETLAALFAPDARFSISGSVGGTTREAVVNFLDSARTAMGLTLHTPNSMLFTFDGPGRARGLIGAHLQLAYGAETVFGAVRYHDDYVRQGGSWQILARDMRTLFIAPWAAVGDAFASATPARWPGAAPAGSDFPRRPKA